MNTNLRRVFVLLWAMASFDEAYSIEPSGYISLASDYKSRGISQTSRDPALIGDVRASFDSGAYIGLWASNLDFGDVEQEEGELGAVELNYYGGYTWQADNNITWDLGYIYYHYAGDANSSDTNYQEIHGILSRDGVTLGIFWSDDYYFSTGRSFYLFTDYSRELPEDFSLDFHVGVTLLDDSGGYLSSSRDSYLDYSITLSRQYLGLTWSISWQDTNLEESDLYDLDWANGSFLFALTRYFN